MMRRTAYAIAFLTALAGPAFGADDPAQAPPVVRTPDDGAQAAPVIPMTATTPDGTQAGQEAGPESEPEVDLEGTPWELVDRGNKACAEGRFAAALQAYDKAAELVPDSAEIAFNRGVALYGNEAFEEARGAFEQAILLSDDSKLQAQSKYNLGNCLYQLGEQQAAGDLNEAFKNMGMGVKYYREALELDPAFERAARNIELGRERMYVIRDVIDRIKEATRLVEETKESLKRLIDEQQQLRDDTGRPLPLWETLGKKQATLNNGTDRLLANADRVQALLEPPERFPEKIRLMRQAVEQAAPELEGASEHQGLAKTALDACQGPEAQQEQDAALEALRKALAILDPPPNEDQQQQDQQQDQQQNDQQQGDQDSQQQNQQQDQQDQGQQEQQQQDKQEGQQESQEAQAAQETQEQDDEEKPNETAQAILAEEGERERPQPPGGYRPVDKDW